MTVYFDRAGEGYLLEDERGVREVEIQALVTDVSGDVWSRRDNARTASGLPRIGQPHRKHTQCLLAEKRVDPGTSTQDFLVTLRYVRPDTDGGGTAPLDRSQPFGPVKWSGGTQVSQEKTVRDASGRLMILTYYGKPVLPFVNYDTSEVSTVQLSGFYRGASLLEADVEVSLLALTAERWERDNPERKAAGFANLTNAVPWRGYGARQVLTTSMSWDPDADGGYVVRYAFLYARRGWRFEGRIRVEGLVPLDAVLGNGLGAWDIYQTTSFAQWRL